MQAQRDEDIAARHAASLDGRWLRGNGAAYRWVYRDPRWRKVRSEQLAREPICRMCGTIATDVDHIIPHQGREAFAFDPDNLQSLCHACHMAKTRFDKGRHKQDAAD